jgi:hypothetical protein
LFGFASFEFNLVVLKTNLFRIQFETVSLETLAPLVACNPSLAPLTDLCSVVFSVGILTVKKGDAFLNRDPPPPSVGLTNQRSDLWSHDRPATNSKTALHLGLRSAPSRLVKEQEESGCGPLSRKEFDEKQ